MHEPDIMPQINGVKIISREKSKNLLDMVDYPIKLSCPNNESSAEWRDWIDRSH